ncbi:hypothetical protein TELCIR_02218 [Teladorsagia circumcincta]|uniref:Tubulin/FtsZ 2-layer sandwich domain-containing protein n=1 Tax=Teladorsagia circumcincta TaxID=45464 RepID=A0A2G9V020_TELCI|nr:hypothetical protein TELCIR_02218 [Teladorsagia circumcincta]
MGQHYLQENDDNAKRDAYREALTVRDITAMCLEPSSQMVKVIYVEAKIWPGDIVPKDVNQAIEYIKMKQVLEFVSWCPTGFKISNETITEDQDDEY